MGGPSREPADPRDPAAFKVVIKPNFMFSHAKEDPSTYADPELVMHLVDLLRARGYSNVKLVEAQSTYGNYYQNRAVKDVAAVLGYDLARYDIVDLTLEKVPLPVSGALGFARGGTHVAGRRFPRLIRQEQGPTCSAITLWRSRTSTAPCRNRTN